MDLRLAALRVYWKLRGWIAPSLRYSQAEYEEVLDRYVRPGSDWLEIGCGRSVLPGWRREEEARIVQRCRSLVGVDYDLASLKDHRTIRKKLRGNITRLPFKDGSFSLATANMVVEHLDDPEAQFRELHRVLRPDGVLLFHTPNALGYGVLLARLVPERLKAKLIRLLERRDEMDVFETHYRANTEPQIRRLAAASGFEVVELDLVNTDAVFAVIPPLALIELLWLRLLMTGPFRSLRTNLIVALRKKPAPG
jgi:ubiquinone/menaquinone biosynthesis C-methylase UbiE